MRNFRRIFADSLIGAFPSLVLLVMSSDLAGIVLLFGFLVAWCTHFLAKRANISRGLSPSNSFTH